MTTSHRDLALVDPWQRSLDRSLHRRAITPAIRRSLARRKRASVALSTLMVAGPTGSLLAAAGFGLGGARAEVAQASPANRAIGNGATPAAMAFKLGSHGDAVTEIQRQLGVAADGFFGPVTQVAVQHFQAQNGLDVDGVVGPATWTALFGLEQAAAAAGAREGNVAVILRERPTDAATTSDGASEDSGSGTPSADPTGPDSDRAGGTPAGGDNALAVGGDIPTSDAPDPAPPATDAPATKPVSTPGNGACGPLQLSDPIKGTVTSGFGPRWGRNHDGLDIAAPTGTPIRAAECGIVSFAGVQSGYGNMVCVKHSSRFETCYAHMTKYAVSQGQRVDQGQVIGYVGCTGNCTGPHLHFETRIDGSARDPRPYLGGGSVPGAPTVKAALGSQTKVAAAAAIANDVRRARFAKQTVAAAPQGATAWSAVESQQPVASTGAPVTAPTPAPTDTAPASPPVSPAPAYEAPVTPAPATAAPSAPAQTEVPPAVAPAESAPPAPAPAPAPVYEAPQADYTTPTAPTYTAPQPASPAPPVEPTPSTPTPASPAPEATVAPTPVTPAPDAAAPTEAPTAAAPTAPTTPTPDPATEVAPSTP